MLHKLPYQAQVAIYSFYGHDIPDLNLLIKVNRQMFANYIDYLYDYSDIVVQYDEHKPVQQKLGLKMMAKFNFIMACVVANTIECEKYKNKKKNFTHYFRELYKNAHNDTKLQKYSYSIETHYSKLYKYDNIMLSNIFTCDRRNVFNLAKYMSSNLASNKEFMMKLVNICPIALEYAADNLRTDKELVTFAVKRNFEFMFYNYDNDNDEDAGYGKIYEWDMFGTADNFFRNDETFIDDLIKELLHDFSGVPEYRRYKMIVYILNYASIELLDNKEFVKKYIPNFGCLHTKPFFEGFYDVISGNLQDDEEILQLCSHNNFLANYYASNRLKTKWYDDLISDAGLLFQ